MKVSSTDFGGADYVPERHEDHRHNWRALWEWACSHGRTCLLLILMGMGMSLLSHIMSAAIDAILLLRTSVRVQGSVFHAPISIRSFCTRTFHPADLRMYVYKGSIFHATRRDPILLYASF